MGNAKLPNRTFRFLTYNRSGFVTNSGYIGKSRLITIPVNTDSSGMNIFEWNICDLVDPKKILSLSKFQILITSGFPVIGAEVKFRTTGNQSELPFRRQDIINRALGQSWSSVWSLSLHLFYGQSSYKSDEMCYVFLWRVTFKHNFWILLLYNKRQVNLDFGYESAWCDTHVWLKNQIKYTIE